MKNITNLKVLNLNLSCNNIGEKVHILKHLKSSFNSTSNLEKLTITLCKNSLGIDNNYFKYLCESI